MNKTPVCTCCCLYCIEGRHCGGAEQDHGVCMVVVDDEPTSDEFDESPYGEEDGLFLYEWEYEE